MRRLHLRDARLARAEPLRDFGLGQPKLFAPTSKAVCQRQLHFDEPSLIGGQAQEVAGITDRPPRTFESSPLIAVHGWLLSCLGRTA